MFMHVSCIRTNIVSILLILNYLVLFCVFLSLFLFLSISCLMAPKRKSTSSWNPLHSGHLLLLLLLILLHLMSGSMIIKPVRTFQRNFHNAALIRNAKSFYWIFPILTFPLSSTIRVGSHCVASQSLVPP